MQSESNWLGGGWIQTFTGKKFFPLHPRIDDVCIEDIAHALSNICRYGGHCKQFYSVAQHCCMVSDWMPELKLEGLMHDAAEAYLGDIVRPVKHSGKMEAFRDAEHHMEAVINVAFDLDTAPDTFELVKNYDNRALFTERKFLLCEPPSPWVGEIAPLPIAALDAWTPESAEREFLNRFYQLSKARYCHVAY